MVLTQACQEWLWGTLLPKETWSFFLFFFLGMKPLLLIPFSVWYISFHAYYILSSLEVATLADRRRKLCLNFANKCIDHDVFKNWFPLEHNKDHDLRMTRKYAIPKFNNDRYDKSPLNYMRRLLNEENSKDMNSQQINRYSK